MTREEAIAILIHEIDGDIFVRTEYRKRIHEALNMGIKALEQEPCDDAISRQAVLETQAKYAEHIGATKFWQMRDDIKALPSVTPQYTDAEIQKMQELEQAEIEKAYELGKAEQPKIGYWIYTLEDWNKWECSECGFTKRTDVHVSIGYKYCPSCGAKMESKEEL